MRCDRKQPCSNCVKAGADCKVNKPAAPNRSKKERLNEDLYPKVKTHWQVFPGEMVESEIRAVQALKADVNGPSTSLSTLHGSFIMENGKPRYVDNNLWTELSNELQDPQEISQSLTSTETRASPVIFDSSASNGSTLLLQHGSSDVPTSAHHPSSLQIFQLWQSYLDNIHPLTKLLHAPTMQHEVLRASADVTSIPKNIDALLFAIYTSAIISLSDVECQTTMSQRKAILSAHYASATEQALVKADFLKSADIVILQAFVLLLVRLIHFRNSQ